MFGQNMNLLSSVLRAHYPAGLQPTHSLPASEDEILGAPMACPQGRVAVLCSSPQAMSSLSTPTSFSQCQTPESPGLCGSKMLPPARPYCLLEPHSGARVTEAGPATQPCDLNGVSPDPL